MVDTQTSAVRRFNRFYTRRLGLLDRGLLGSELSLTEVRILYELAQRRDAAASDLARDMALDAGYLSRILAGFQRRGLVRRRRAPGDRRRAVLELTRRGRGRFAELDRLASEQVKDILEGLSAERRGRLVEAMRTIEEALAPSASEKAPYLLRPPGPGDLGWVIERHGALYAEEYGWNQDFEALVADIVARFAAHFDPARERCWIAEREGERLGCVFLVQKSRTVAQLRLLLVEPSARGLGIGGRLVDECSRFARQAGYRKIVLWTNSVLTAARGIYERAGYTLVAEERHHSFGRDLVGQTWELTLD
jgi:DNA-binding MarR family transcriptional regulator/N-acetylglutamate synthase-like GNAT family acetyltransferase